MRNSTFPYGTFSPRCRGRAHSTAVRPFGKYRAFRPKRNAGEKCQLGEIATVLRASRKTTARQIRDDELSRR